MCGRFYIDDELTRELEKICRKVDEKTKELSGDKKIIMPSDRSLVIKNDLFLSTGRFGYTYSPDSNTKRIINARAESLMEKKMFAYHFWEQRCVIPARGFYEWDNEKNRYFFSVQQTGEARQEVGAQHEVEARRVDRKQLPFFYMAGIYNKRAEDDEFVIITTSPNREMKEIHDRMPLILSVKESKDWLTSNETAKELLYRKNMDGILEVVLEEQKRKKGEMDGQISLF